MRLNIEPTPDIIDYDGFRCRVWRGWTMDGREVTAFVRCVRFLESESVGVGEILQEIGEVPDAVKSYKVARCESERINLEKNIALKNIR